VLCGWDHLDVWLMQTTQTRTKEQQQHLPDKEWS